MVWMLVLMIGAADAKPKEAFYVGEASPVPVVGGDAAALASAPACVRWGAAGALPRVEACPAVVAPLFAQATCDDGKMLCAPTPRSSRQAGVVTIDPAGLGLRGERSAWLLDLATTGVTAYQHNGLATADDAAVDALAAWCESKPEVAIVREVWTGCARVGPQAGVPAEGTLKLKDAMGGLTTVGTGRFWIDGAGESTVCEDRTVIAVTPRSAADVCASEVLPEALRRSSQRLSSFQASPDAVSGPVRILIGEIAVLKAEAAAMQARAPVALDVTASVERSMEAARTRLAALDASDARFVTLLSKVELVTAGLVEARSKAEGITARAKALADEAGAVAEKVNQPALDALLVTRLSGQVRDVVSRVRALSQEHAHLLDRLAELRADVSYLEGGVSVSEPAAAKR